MKFYALEEFRKHFPYCKTGQKVLFLTAITALISTVRTMTFRRLLLFFLAASIFSPHLRAQVNTESMRKYNAEPGFHHTLGLNLSLLSGNSDVLMTRGNYRLDWLSTNYYSFFVASYQRGKSNGDLFANKAFAHLRTSRNVSDHFLVEAFGQKEFNDFLKLKDRQLLGAGLRYELYVNADSGRRDRPRIIFAAGAGAMGESEKFNDLASENTRLVRSTNYLSIRWNLDDRLYFTSTGYLQFAFRRLKDYRILNDSSLAFSINRHLSFSTLFNFRYDHEPPSGLKRYDLELTNGFSLSF